MPFSKRKPGRDPLQRLSDQRRSLALAGLAAGAVLSAAIFRRRRHVTPEFERPIPPPAAPPESGSHAAVEPEVPTATDAINAAATVATEVAATAPREERPKPFDPPTGELSAEEASILAVLAQSGRTDDDRTAIAVATSLERETADVTGVLRKLSSEGVVSGELYTAAGDKIWAVTERGVRRLGAQS